MNFRSTLFAVLVLGAATTPVRAQFGPHPLDRGQALLGVASGMSQPENPLAPTRLHRSPVVPITSACQPTAPDLGVRARIPQFGNTEATTGDWPSKNKSESRPPPAPGPGAPPQWIARRGDNLSIIARDIHRNLAAAYPGRPPSPSAIAFELVKLNGLATVRLELTKGQVLRIPAAWDVDPLGYQSAE